MNRFRFKFTTSKIIAVIIAIGLIITGIIGISNLVQNSAFFPYNKNADIFAIFILFISATIFLLGAFTPFLKLNENHLFIFNLVFMLKINYLDIQYIAFDKEATKMVLYYEDKITENKNNPEFPNIKFVNILIPKKYYDIFLNEIKSKNNLIQIEKYEGKNKDNE